MPVRTGVLTILVADDNVDTRRVVRWMLEQRGYAVIEAADAQVAAAMARIHRVDLLVTDVVMPGMSGVELADQLSRLQPGLPVILTTGYSDQLAESGTGGRPVILKPYRLETLSAALDSALGVEAK